MNDFIDKSSPIPYYVQLKNILQHKIENNIFVDGKLPSEHELANKYQITVTTVRKVLAGLQNEDMIHKAKGLGSFVKKPKIELDITKYLSFGRIIKEKGLNEKISVIKKEVIDFNEKLLNGFSIKKPCKKVVHFNRIRSIEDEPMAIEKLFFNHDICGSMFQEATDNLVYYYLVEELKINFSVIEEYLEPVNLNKTEAKILNVREKSAALLITKLTFDTKDNWIEYSNLIIRGDKCRYHVRLK